METQKALDMIRELAGKLGQTTEYLWPHAVRYVAIREAIAFSASLVALAFSLYFLKRSWSNAIFEEWEETPSVIAPVIVSSIFVFVTTFEFLLGGIPAISRFLEPVGYTVILILQK